MPTETLPITGMTCAHCVRAVRHALEAVPGVTVEDVRIGEARFHADSPDARTAAVGAIEAEGYRVAEAPAAGV